MASRNLDRLVSFLGVDDAELEEDEVEEVVGWTSSEAASANSHSLNL